MVPSFGAGNAREAVAQGVVLQILCLRPPAHAGERFYHAENYQADPEIHDEPEIQMRSGVSCWSRKVRHDQEIDRISGQDRDQRVHEIAHSCFRHRSPPS
jgi:hypothetical protein